MFSKKLFGQRINQARKQRKETQAQLGALLGVSNAQISDMEAVKKTTTVENVALICRHYGVSADYLLGLTDDPTPPGAAEEEKP